MSGVELLVRNALEASPLFRPLAPEGARLPEAPAPQWRGLSLVVPSPPALSANDLLARLAELRRQLADRRRRVQGEPVALGDDVQVRMVGYARGRLIPGAVRYEEWIELTPDDDLPGFAEQLAGTPVGSSARVSTTHRGERAEYIVDVLDACAVTPLDDDSPELLDRLGRGSTLDAVMASLAADVEEERSEWCRRELRERAIDELAVRVRVEVPPQLLREEIRRRWMEREGRRLAWLGLDADEQQSALQGWMEDDTVVIQVDRSVRAYLALSAIAREERLQPDFSSWFDSLAEITREPRESIRSTIVRDRTLSARLAEVATQAAALDLVMSHASIAAGD